MADIMKRKLTGLSRRYLAALQKYLAQESAGTPPALALRLGRQAADLGLGGLELARIHGRALDVLDLSKGSDGKRRLVRRAEMFFDEAIVPLMDAQRSARQGRTELNLSDGILNQHTLDLAATHRQLQQAVTREKRAEATRHRSGAHYPRLLKESLKLQEGLRQTTHQKISAQEQERHTISRQLQDEIAQTLLGIHVRLSNLRAAVRGDKSNFAKEIASTQRLVRESVKSINRFARGLNFQVPA